MAPSLAAGAAATTAAKGKERQASGANEDNGSPFPQNEVTPF